MPGPAKQLVATIPERCRMCYTCVRDCPAKAIRISGGQAEVVAERCIGCGNCVKECSQNAKRVADSTIRVRELLSAARPVAAIIAPSFPAEFPELESERLAAMVRELGFDIVSEVAFGADLVARRYRDLLDEDADRSWIATTCPAVVSFVEKFQPDLVPFLAPVASPMAATARALRRRHGDDLHVVFVGPCIAKKNEAGRSDVRDDVDAVLSFAELRSMMMNEKLDAGAVTPTAFDGPHPGLGALFPVSRGMLQAAGLSEDLLTNDVVAGTGISNFIAALEEFGGGMMNVRLLELLSCQGCIMGAGMTTTAPSYRRRTLVGDYARSRIADADPAEIAAQEAEFADLDLSASFRANDTRMPSPSDTELDEILHRLGKDTVADELDCGACGYPTCREHAVAIHKGMAETEMCLPHTIERLRESLDEVQRSHVELADTHQALIQAEKLASMGQLSAGIAHEVNNPLGVVLLYAEMLLDETDPNSEQYADIKTIADQAERCRTVVGGLLDFARENKVVLMATDMRRVVDRSLRGVVIPDGVEVVLEDRLTDPMVDLDSDQMVQVFTNLIKNAVEAMPDGGVLRISASGASERVKVLVADTGTGIPPELRQKIFEPLFTTKRVGEGTGLGLAVTYGIVKMHRGSLTVTSNNDTNEGPTGTTFTVDLPRHGKGDES